MRIFVDEMPRKPQDCIFLEITPGIGNCLFSKGPCQLIHGVVCTRLILLGKRRAKEAKEDVE